MDEFLLLGKKDKRAYFESAAEKLNIMPQLIEKDFWVCWVLKALFSLKGIGEHLTFKGGTSLSKCYNVIKRFSEDIDISIERLYLSKSKTIEPDKNASNKENQKRLKELQLICRNRIHEAIFPKLRNELAVAFSSEKGWNIDFASEDQSGQTVLFTFPQIVISNANNYIRPSVKIEFGARANHWPVESIIVTPYIACISREYKITGVPVRVLSANRTFWEKATILHMLYHYPHDKNIPPRMSRHYYDLYAMAGSSICKSALENIALLKTNEN